MSSKTLNHLRVVINLNDDEDISHDINYYKANYLSVDDIQHNLNGQSKSPPIRSSQSLPGVDNMKAEVIIIDDKCLKLNLLSTEDDGPYTDISHKMHFDHVNRSSINIMKTELALVMDDLLLKQINCSIIRFSNKLEMDITIFFDLFITFLNKRIYHHKYKLQYIKLECLDIAASAGNTGAQPTEEGLILRANLADSVISPNDNCNDSNATYRLIKNSQNNFRSTRDLLLWLLNEYRYKFAEHGGHEKLQFTFSILDHQQNSFKVKLSLFNIYLDLMRTEDRNHWLHFMDHIGDGCQGLDCNFIHSGLTISLSGHIEGIASQNTLFIFNVPTDVNMTTDTIELLQMAHAVIQNRKRKQIKFSKAVNQSRRISLSNRDCAKNVFPLKGEEKCNDLSVNYNKDRRSSLPQLKDQEAKDLTYYMNYNIDQLPVDKWFIDNPFSEKDFNTLSGWYRKIDERFINVCQLREKYFKRYFALKFSEITDNIKHTYKSLESYTKSTKSDFVIPQENQIELHELFERYHNARALFRQLTETIQNTEFVELLKIYLDTKTFDLNKHALTLKRKYLEFSQHQLKLTLNEISSDFEWPNK